MGRSPRHLLASQARSTGELAWTASETDSAAISWQEMKPPKGYAVGKGRIVRPPSSVQPALLAGRSSDNGLTGLGNFLETAHRSPLLLPALLCTGDSYERLQGPWKARVLPSKTTASGIIPKKCGHESLERRRSVSGDVLGPVVSFPFDEDRVDPCITGGSDEDCHENPHDRREEEDRAVQDGISRRRRGPRDVSAPGARDRLKLTGRAKKGST